MMPILIAGPTASGKSGLAIRLAKKFGGEIICADSRQFYKYMSIGTAQPTLEDQKAVPHHGYGILDPRWQRMDAGQFVKFATARIDEITKSGKRPIVVGGTGLYLRALYYGFLDVPPSNEAVLQKIYNEYERYGLEHLYETLKKIDIHTANALQPNDRYRIVRALEIHALTQRPPSELRKSFIGSSGQMMAHCIYKKPKKDSLLKDIESRVHTMFASGLIEEAKCLRKRLPKEHWLLKVMGYQEALAFVDKGSTLDEAITRTVIRHRQYAKRQYTWFNKEPFYRLLISDTQLGAYLP